MPVTVEGMNKAMPWETANLGPRARRLAEDAAHRAGMSPEEWLSEAIVEHAAFVRSEDAAEDVQFRDRRREWMSVPGGVGPDGRRTGHPQDQQIPGAEDLLESTVQQIERRIARNGQRLAEAFEAIALRLERSNASLDRLAFVEEEPPSDAVEMAQTNEGPLSLKGRGAGAAPVFTQPSDADPRFAREMNEDDSTTARSAPSPQESSAQPVLASEQPRLDLKSAVSQIALRRRELDLREARRPLPPARPTSETGRANAGLAAEGLSAGQPQAREREADPQAGYARDPADPGDDLTRNNSNRPESGALAEPPQAVRNDIRALASKLDTVLRADQRIGVAEVNAMRAEIAAMARSLADLAPRNSVVALEGAVRDLSERVDKLRQSGCQESVLEPLDAMAAEFRAALKAHDPRLAAAALEREIGAIGAKIDGLAHSAINPETFERIRIQTEEVRNLLAAAAMRTAPVERLERKIGELADRVERVGVSPLPHVESAEMAALLADFRREIERSTSLPTLVSIEQRLERIATRLDEEIARPIRASFDAAPFDDLAQRIDGVRQTLEARPQVQVDANRLEASLKELSAKLESPNPEPIVALMREINAKLDAAGQREVDELSIEPLLEGIIGKLNQLQPSEAPASSLDLRRLESMLQLLHAKLEKPSVPALDRQAIDEIAEEIARRVLDGSAGRVETDMLAEQIAVIHDRLDGLSASSRAPEALEPLVRELLEKLAEAGGPPPARFGSTNSQPSLVEELAEMRAEQANVDRRTQAQLAGVQDLLEKLIARLANAEVETLTAAQDAGFRKASFNVVQGADAFAEIPPMSAQSRGTLGPGSPANGRELSAQPPVGEDFLLEPGAGAPQRAQEARDLAQAIGSRTNPAVSAHIAAARRAAQAAGGDSGSADMPHPSSLASRRVGQAKTFYDNHRRSLLLAVALAIVATVAARLVGIHAPFLQRPESDGRPVKAAGTDAPARNGFDFALGAKTDSRPVDTTARPLDTSPTGSITTSSEPAKTNSIVGTLPPELITAIPLGLPQGLRDAVVEGSPGAQYELGQRLFEGRGIPQDQHAAAIWLERAASSGFAPAQFRIGALYQKGVGVARDAATAKRWYAMAAEAGNARAAHNLAVMNAEPTDDKPDYVEAAKWFRKAAELGVRDSQYNLAVLYARGLGVEQDFRQSWLWFSLAAAQGDADAAKKRDEVAAKMNPQELATAADELAKFKVATPDPAANDVATPPGGWDAKPLGQTIPAPGGQRPQARL
jgi:localization factor PodJL